VYLDGTASAEELSQLEPAFLMGLRAKDADIRNKFLSLYHSRVAHLVGERLRHIVAGQSWEPLADTFWIRHAGELLLGAIRYPPATSHHHHLSCPCASA
jgi:transformation/transcription domain-associated protein